MRYKKLVDRAGSAGLAIPKKSTVLQVDRFWKLLELALGDLQVVELHPRFAVNMAEYVYKTKPDRIGVDCECGLAGALMCRRLPVFREGATTPSMYKSKPLENTARPLENRLNALEMLQLGHVKGALTRFYLRGAKKPGSFDTRVERVQLHLSLAATDPLRPVMFCAYDEHREAWWTWAKRVLSVLKEECV